MTDTFSAAGPNTGTKPPTAKPEIRRWIWILTLTAAALGVAAAVSPYLWQAPEDYGFAAQREVYAANRVTMMIHIGCGIVALLAGLLQFLPSAKAHRLRHRWVGGVYVISVLLGGIAGLRAAGFAAGGASNMVAFTLFSLFWLSTTAMALASLWQGRIAAHQLWMKRSFALTFGAVTFRAELGLLIGVGGLSFSEAYLVVPWSSWVLNLLLVEWVPAFRHFQMPQRAAPPTRG